MSPPAGTLGEYPWGGPPGGGPLAGVPLDVGPPGEAAARGCAPPAGTTGGGPFIPPEADEADEKIGGGPTLVPLPCDVFIGELLSKELLLPCALLTLGDALEVDVLPGDAFDGDCIPADMVATFGEKTVGDTIFESTGKAGRMLPGDAVGVNLPGETRPSLELLTFGEGANDASNRLDKLPGTAGLGAIVFDGVNFFDSGVVGAFGTTGGPFDIPITGGGRGEGMEDAGIEEDPRPSS